METMEHPPLKVVILEDNPGDAKLIIHQLQASGYQIESQICTGKNTFLNALLRFYPDIILADYRLPDFNGLDALRVARSLRPNIPFVFVTGSIDRAIADETVLAGANDYLLKKEMERLPQLIAKVMENHAWMAFHHDPSVAPASPQQREKLIQQETESLKRTLKEFQQALSEPGFILSPEANVLSGRVSHSMETIRKLHEGVC